jgi:MFS family permease
VNVSGTARTQHNGAVAAPRRPLEPLHLRRAQLAVAYSFLVHGVMFGAWASRIPAIQSRTGLDSTHLGFALLAASGGAVLAMSFAGVLAGRFGSHKVTVAMLLGYAACVPGLAACGLLRHADRRVAVSSAPSRARWTWR